MDNGQRLIGRRKMPKSTDAELTHVVVLPAGAAVARVMGRKARAPKLKGEKIPLPGTEDAPTKAPGEENSLAAWADIILGKPASATGDPPPPVQEAAASLLPGFDTPGGLGADEKARATAELRRAVHHACVVMRRHVGSFVLNEAADRLETAMRAV